MIVRYSQYSNNLSCESRMPGFRVRIPVDSLTRREPGYTIFWRLEGIRDSVVFPQDFQKTWGHVNEVIKVGYVHQGMALLKLIGWILVFKYQDYPVFWPFMAYLSHGTGFHTF